MPTLSQRTPPWPARIVVIEVASLVVLLAALADRMLAWLVAAPVAAALVVLGLLRWRSRPLSAWLGTGLGYLIRHRSMPPSADPAALLAFADPRAVFTAPRAGASRSGADPRLDRSHSGAGHPGGTRSAGPAWRGSDGVAAIEDTDGVVAVIELGADEAVAGTPPPVSPAELLAVSGVSAVSLVVSVAPPPGAGPPAAAYRQLTGGVVPARQRALLALRVSRDDATLWTDGPRDALTGGLRRVCRRLERDRVPHRRLSTAAAQAALTDLAGPDPHAGAREGWSRLVLAGLHQATLRAAGIDRLPIRLVEEAVAQTLTAPAVATTVGLCAIAGGTELTVRIAAGGRAHLDVAASAVARMLAAAGAVPLPLDGRQRDGLAATLPLARPARTTGRPDRTVRPDGRMSPPAVAAPGERAAFPSPQTRIRVRLAPSGLMLGLDRHARPLTVRLFRPVPTLAMLVGGVRTAQLLGLRGLALGAAVIVRTTRPAEWEPLLRSVGPGDPPVHLLPPGAPAPGAPNGPATPQLIILDTDAHTVAPAPWRATLLVRGDVSAADAVALTRADLVLLQASRPDEAELIADVLGLRASRDWLGRLRPDMVGAVSRVDGDRGAVRWAMLSATEIEQRLIGSPVRVPAG